MDAAETAEPRPRMRVDDSAQIGRLERVLHVAFPPRTPAAEPSARPPERDFARAIDLVRDAAEMIRAADQRAAGSQQRMDELVGRATEELRAADMRVQAADARARAAEARAEEAETHLRTAEEWLARIYEVIAEELPQRLEADALRAG